MRPRSYYLAAVRRACAAIASAEVGHRTATLSREARSLFRLAPALPASIVVADLGAAAASAGLRRDAVAEIFRTVLRGLP